MPDALAIAGDLDGTNKEFMSHYGPNSSYNDCSSNVYQSPFTGSTLSGWQDYAVGVGATTSFGHATTFTGIDYELLGDLAKMTYGRADFLLTWSGMPHSGAYMNRPCTNDDPANPPNDVWTTQLGLPADPAEPALVGGLYVRRYTQGTVVLNPASSGAVSYRIDGTYVDQDGHVYHNQSVQIAPTTALLLTRRSFA